MSHTLLQDEHLSEGAVQMEATHDETLRTRDGFEILPDLNIAGIQMVTLLEPLVTQIARVRQEQHFVELQVQDSKTILLNREAWEAMGRSMGWYSETPKKKR